MTEPKIDKFPNEFKEMYRNCLLWLYRNFYKEVPHKPLFHYTTQNGLLGIIESKSLWLSDNQYMNDMTEYNHTIDLVKDELKKRGYEKFRKFLDTIDSGFETLLENIYEKYPFFVCSFCENGNLLSQWRGYCSNGGGYSIGFDKAHIVKLRKKYKKFNFVRCVYEKKIQKEIIRKYLKDSVSTFQKFNISNCNDANLTRIFISNFFKMLLTIIPMLKDSSFREECEWRIVSNFRKIKPSQKKFREGKFAIVPYVEFKLANKREKLNISKIIVGPNPHIELSLKSVKSILSAQNVNCALVERSRIPYRGW